MNLTADIVIRANQERERAASVGATSAKKYWDLND